MLRSAWLRHRAIFVMVCVLLLKAAVPMLASGAAGLQGKSVAEICTVYGVVTIAAQQAMDAQHAGHAAHASDAGHDGHVGHAAHANHADHAGVDHSHHAAGAHGGDHCALAGLVALAAEDEPAPFVAPPVHRAPALAPVTCACAPSDSCALWVARLKQGPPGLA